MKRTTAPPLFPSPAVACRAAKEGSRIGFAPPQGPCSRPVQKAQKRAIPSGLPRPCYEVMEDWTNGNSSKRYKEEACSFDSQDTNETSRETPIGLLECTENIGIPEVAAENEDPAEHIKDSCENESNDTEVLGAETLNYLICREQAYTPDPYYLEKSQPDLSWTMRLILLDWIMEVCMEFQLKRETFHYSVNFVDRFLTLFPRVSKVDLQLVGVTALYIAAKMEEVRVPKIQEFAKSTDNGYTIEQIYKMELIILKTLRWALAPPTLNMWANWYMSQWDNYIQSSDYAKNHILTKSLHDPMVVFKFPNEKAYARFRELSQLIDTSILDVVTLSYQPRAVVASALYVLLAFHFGQATLQEIVTQFPRTSFFLNMQFPFNDLFGDFLRECFGFDLPELLPTIQYMATFLALPFNYTFPAIHKYYSENEDKNNNFEEFLSYQTHHPKQLEFIRYKPR